VGREEGGTTKSSNFTWPVGPRFTLQSMRGLGVRRIGGSEPTDASITTHLEVSGASISETLAFLECLMTRR
jgi:hypothetical protein